MAYYLDTSALVKGYAHETGTELPPLNFISADNDLNTAAQAEGLVTDDPNTHS